MPISRDILYRVLKGCSKKKDLTACRRVHSIMVSSGFDSLAILADHLIRLFALCGSLLEANLVFSKVEKPSVYTWQSIISAHSRHGESGMALDLYIKMLQKGIEPDRVTCLCILQACGSIGDLRQANCIHDHIIQHRHELDKKVANTIVDMYAKCGSLDAAANTFNKLQNRTVVSWTAMIAGYAQHGHGIVALELFVKMKHFGIEPDSCTFSCILKACTSIGDVGQGMLIHSHIIGSGVESNVIIGSSLVDMYAKCGSLEEAQRVFDKLPTRNVVSWNAMITGYSQNQDILHANELFERMQHEGIQPSVVSWNAMISGYVQHGLGLPAIEFFHRMQLAGMEPDKATYCCILSACSIVGALAQGRMIHYQIVKRAFELDSIIWNSLVDMYAKSSSLEDGCQLLDELAKQDAASWGGRIGGYVQPHKLAMQCFNNLQRGCVEPFGLSYSSTPAVCSLVGHMEDRMFPPKIEQLNFMIDLFGRAGCLNEAVEILNTLPFLPNITGWMSLLTACRAFGNVELGRKCFDQIIQLDPNVAAGYVLMSNIYADAHRWDEACKMQQLREGAGAWKKPGKSWIEIGSKLHEFDVRDQSHEHNDKIHAEIRRLRRQTEEEGHVPQLNSVIEPLTDEEKDDVLWGHSEKLAVAFGLLSTPKGTSIRVSKNLRVCADCHNVMKIISNIEKRQIIIRDAHLVHHFEGGKCYCGDQYL